MLNKDNKDGTGDNGSTGSKEGGTDGDEKKPKTGEDGGSGDSDGDNNDDGGGNDDKTKPIPYAVFKAKNELAKKLQAELDKIKSEQDEKRQEELKKQNRFEELAAEWKEKAEGIETLHNAGTERLEALEKTLGEYANKQLELIPEPFKELVKLLPVDEQLKWFNENKEKIEKNGPSGIPQTPPGNGGNELTDDEKRKKAARTF